MERDFDYEKDLPAMDDPITDLDTNNISITNLRKTMVSTIDFKTNVKLSNEIKNIKKNI